jgi:hypothetical protein
VEVPRRLGSPTFGDVALVLGFLALGRGDRYGHRARWAAVFGIMFGAIFYAIFVLAMARDLFDPVLLR